MTEIKKEDFEKKLSNLSEEEKEEIMLAYKFAELGHKGQLRDGGEPYFEHPKRAALILIDELNIIDSHLLLISDMIVAELLHDIKEESSILTWEEIELFFGPVVKLMVETLTKDKSLPLRERDEKYMEKLKNADTDARIKMVKLADRLDNLRTLQACSAAKQKHIIQETQEHYLDLAEKTSDYLFEEMKKIIENPGFEK